MQRRHTNLLNLLSVIIPVTERPSDAKDIYHDYRAALDRLDIPYEMIFVLDGPFQDFRKELEGLSRDGNELTTIQLGKHFVVKRDGN